MEKVLFSWSGGKDSAMALHEILAGQDYEVIALLTTVTDDYDRISMHGVRRVLLERQAESVGIPLEKVLISKQSSNEEYETRMTQVLKKYKELGVSSVVFGDIFLEDLREYREKNLAQLEMRGIFPIWKRDTTQLMQSFIAQGFKAVTVCVDTQALDSRFVGRTIDQQFMNDLPRTVDICGENGEYHSFVYDGPIFKRSISFTLGETLLRENRFCYCDLVPSEEKLHMEIKIREIDEQTVKNVNQFENVFTVYSHLVVSAESGKISYRIVPVEPYEKRYSIDTADYSRYVDAVDKTVFFAEVDGELAGQIRLLTWWNKYAYIDDIVVEPKFRGQGVGHALIQQAIAWAKSNGYPGVMLETQNNNVAACRLYESCGFTLGGFDQYLYKGNDPATQEIALYWYLVF